MKKIIFNIMISLLVSILFYFLSTKLFFSIPSPAGGYTAITYQVGIGFAVLAGGVTAVLLFIFNKNKPH